MLRLSPERPVGVNHREKEEYDRSHIEESTPDQGRSLLPYSMAGAEGSSGEDGGGAGSGACKA